jgi:hypothetical protein
MYTNSPPAAARYMSALLAALTRSAQYERSTHRSRSLHIHSAPQLQQRHPHLSQTYVFRTVIMVVGVDSGISIAVRVWRRPRKCRGVLVCQSSLRQGGDGLAIREGSVHLKDDFRVALLVTYLYQLLPQEPDHFGQGLLGRWEIRLTVLLDPVVQLVLAARTHDDDIRLDLLGHFRFSCCYT